MRRRKHIRLAALLAVVLALVPLSTTAANEYDTTFADAPIPPQHIVSGFSEAAEPSDPDALVDIPDPVLRRALEEELGKEEDEPITQGDMALLTRAR